MAKKKSIKKEVTTTSHCVCPGKGALVFKGIISIILGLILWFDYLTLAQIAAVVLILVGIKKLYYSSKCIC